MSGYKPTRRELLRDGAVLTAAGLLAGACAPETQLQGLDAGPDPTTALPDADRMRPPPPMDLPESMAFPLGVATGDVDSRDGGQTVFWARHTGEAPLRLVIWERGARAVSADRTVEKGDGGYVHASVTNLRPGVVHEYVFTEIVNGQPMARSPIGTLRAPYAEDELPELTIGAYACTKQGRDFSTLLRGAERDLDAVLLLGDGSYCEGSRTLAEYRMRWSENLQTTAYRTLRGRAPYVSTWDDHDVDNNWDPESFDPARLAVATQAFFESQPIRRQEAAPDRVWRSVRFGSTLEVFALDCKSERRNAQNLFISRAQMDWLKAGLDGSPCAFKLIMSSLPIGDFPWPWDFVDAQRWTGFPAQREEILRFIDDKRIEGLVWLGGDFHLGSVGRVAKSGLGSTQHEILCGPGAQRGNPLVYTMGNEQWPFATGTSNITIFRLDPRLGRVVVQHVDGGGSVLNEAKLFA